MSYQTVQYVPGFDYGVGVDTLSGSPCNVAVSGEPTAVPGAPGSTLDAYLARIQSFEDLTTKLGISTRASGGFGLFSASAKLSFAKDSHVESSSLFMLVVVRVTQGALAIKAPRFLPEADKLLADGNAAGKMEEFYRLYGDKFVRSFLTGGQFFALMNIQTKTVQLRETIAGKIKAAYGGFIGGGVQSFQQVTQAAEMESMTISCHIEGGDPEKGLPTTADAMFARASSFPSEVPGHALPYTAVLSDYSIVPTSARPTFPDLLQRRTVLEKYAERRDNLVQLLDDVNYINAHREQFEPVGPDQPSRDALRHDLDIIDGAALKALNTPQPEVLPETAYAVHLPVTLPLRKGQLARSVGGRRPSAHRLRPLPPAPMLHELFELQKELDTAIPIA